MIPSTQNLWLGLHRLFNSNTDRSDKKKDNVVVVGYGWGASAFTNNIDTRKYNVKVISKTTNRFNQPYIIADMEPSFTEPPSRTEIIEDEALSIDRSTQHLIAKQNKYSYDYLIIATGSEPNDFGVKGVSNHCLMFKTESDLQKLKDKLTTHSDISVIGAGPTGIELAFKLRSLGKSVTILEASTSILPGFSENMRKIVLNLLSSQNITIRPNTKITQVQNNGYTTPEGVVTDESVKIWTCGIKPVAFAREFMSPLKPDSNLLLAPKIYAIGDSIIGHGPPTAQNASCQGKYLAELFNSDFTIEQQYKYLEKGRVIDATTCLLVEYNENVLVLPSLFRIIYKSLTA